MNTVLSKVNAYTAGPQKKSKRDREKEAAEAYVVRLKHRSCSDHIK